MSTVLWTSNTVKSSPWIPVLRKLSLQTKCTLKHELAVVKGLSRYCDLKPLKVEDFSG